MNKVNNLFNKFISNKIEKSDYIKEMHKIHSNLFEYSEFIKNTDISKIEITDDTVIMTSREANIKIVCDHNDYRIAPIEILNFSYYEKEDSDLITKILDDITKPDSVIFDIGANIGWYSINFAKNHTYSFIYAFEPVPKTHNYLVANCLLNGIKNVRYEQKGLSDSKGTLDIFYYPEGSGNASLRKLTDDQNILKFSAAITTIDDYAKEKDIKNLDFIKCDVEGAELFTFRGGKNTIMTHKPAIFTEMLRKWSAKFDYHPNDIIQFFQELNYSCYVSNQTGGLKVCEYVDDSTIETNYFFLHKNRHKSLINNLVD